MESVVRLEPIDTIKHGISSAAGIQCSIVAFFLFGIIAGLIIWRGSGKESYDERNFEISQKGTYGTAGFMGEEERSQVLRTDKNLEKVDGVIFGRDIQDKKIISLPVESRLNRNFAVCTCTSGYAGYRGNNDSCLHCGCGCGSAGEYRTGNRVKSVTTIRASA